MNAATLGANLVRHIARRRGKTAVLGLFSGTMFLSALLLFSVQPIFAKMVLPKLGGAPSVWAVSMCFFQAVLLAGYCYAHALNRCVGLRHAPTVHLTLLGLALLTLPVGLPMVWSEPPAGDAYLWLTGVLAAGVGLPFFAVSANAPLLQAWFSRTGHPHAADPYFLYGASNLGSLIALLAYPVVVEPFAGLGRQAAFWTSGFIVLGLCIAFCGLAAVTLAGSGARALSVASDMSDDRTRPGWDSRAQWIGLAFVPSGLLIAFTSYVTTDIASAPFLWVIPLALFLLTFILVFRDPPVLPHRVLLLGQPLLVTGVFFGFATAGNTGWLLTCALGTAAFFVTTMVAHRELYERRPAARHLTEFYLWMSLGGVLGGLFAAIVAPQIFNAVWEFPILLILGMACRPGLDRLQRAGEDLRRFALPVAGIILLMAAVGWLLTDSTGPWSPLSRIAFVGIFGAAALFARDMPFRQLLLVAGMLLTIVLLPSPMNRGNAERSFFGIHRVTMTPDRQMRVLMHGTTIHGSERIVPTDGWPGDAPVPATYYHPGGPMALGVIAARAASGHRDGAFKAGIVGLGAGSMACYSRPGEAWRFYEIDPVVMRIARDSDQFSFLSRCRPDADIVIGDARITLAKEPAHTLDYLLVDAFSSDAVPVHLMTVEALTLYLDKLSPDGVLALHVSNRHLDMVSVAAATARSIPGTKTLYVRDPQPNTSLDKVASDVIFVVKSAKAFEAVKALPYAAPLPPPAIPAWTDDYSNIVTAVWRKYW